MPLITIKVFEDELSNSQAKDLIHKVTANRKLSQKDSLLAL
jgi:phenylpyruvate tautomerase PptA (4-oxalocrotonate tautomerase family)